MVHGPTPGFFISWLWTMGNSLLRSNIPLCYMSSSSDFSQNFDSLSSSVSLASGESWQDIQEELLSAPQTKDSSKPSHSETQEQELDDRPNDIDDLNFLLGEGSRLPRPTQSMADSGQATSMIQYSMMKTSLSFNDGNIDLVVGTNTFRLHEYKLQEFAVIKAMVEAERGTHGGKMNIPPLRITLEADVDDVCNTLSVLYSPVYAAETQGFGVDVLKSTLWFATKFQHPALRSFAIRHLENESISPIERIAISRQSNVSSWMRPALDELCVREAPISFIEAITLGMKTFVEVAARREVYKSTVGHELVAFKDALRNKTHGGSDSVEICSGYNLVVDPQQLAEHKSALDHIITAAFSVVSSKAPSNDGCQA